ncbi:ribosomal protein L7/L12 [Streptomyces monticola]|uniref:Ribosomal protein L7/L12 n=1 Tax=Streptomyces monticola TaxID=2666263 RepID=A0ABW2JE10_9ACTN
MDMTALSSAFFFVLVAALLCSGLIERKIERADRRVARVERKLDAVMAHLGISEPDPLGTELSRVTDLLDRGRKIEAIKVYREVTGAGLKEAKDAVDRVEATR